MLNIAPPATMVAIPVRNTQHHVYYVVFPDHVFVVAVWGAIKDTEAPL